VTLFATATDASAQRGLWMGARRLMRKTGDAIMTTGGQGGDSRYGDLGGVGGTGFTGNH
jgi:hypothetical protein